MSLLKQLLADPKRHRLAERGEASRREGQIGFDQPLEFHERLFIEDDVVDLGGADRPALRQYAIALRGKAGSCFLRVKRSSCAAAMISPVRDNGSGAVVIESRNAEDRASRGQNSV